MSLPILSGVGRLTGDPELRFTPSGVAMCKVNLAFNQRRKNDKGEWEDGDVLFLAATVWRETAEAVAEHLAKGSEVVVTGRPRTRSWQTESGEKRSAIELLVDSIGPTTRQMTKKTTRTNGKADDDPWGPSGQADEPPF